MSEPAKRWFGKEMGENSARSLADGLVALRAENERLKEQLTGLRGSVNDFFLSAPPSLSVEGIEKLIRHAVNFSEVEDFTDEAIAAVRQLAEHLRHAHSFAAFVVKERDAAREELAKCQDDSAVWKHMNALQDELAALKRGPEHGRQQRH